MESCCGRSSPSGGPRTLASLWRSYSHCCGRGTGWTGPRTALQNCEASIPPPTHTVQSSPSALTAPPCLPLNGPSPREAPPPPQGLRIPLTLRPLSQVRADAGVLARGPLSTAHVQAAGGGTGQGPAGRLGRGTPPPLSWDLSLPAALSHPVFLTSGLSPVSVSALEIRCMAPWGIGGKDALCT